MIGPSNLWSIGLEKGHQNGAVVRRPEREMEAGFGSRQGYYPVSGENRQVDLPTGGFTGSIRDGLLSHSP
jgi:hypothetical protein